MKSCKCSKTEQHWVLAKVLRNAPAKIQRKNQRKIKKAKLEAVWTMWKTWQILSHLSNLCLLFSCEKIKLMFSYQRITLFTLLVWNLKPIKVPSLFLINQPSPSFHHDLHVCICIGVIEGWLYLFVRKGQNVKHWVFLSSAWITYLVDIN